MPLLSVVIPLRVGQWTEAPRWTVAALLLNTLGVVALQVLGETALASGAREISFGLAPDGRHGQY
ncbi:hypothetical protein [Streptomyces pini]|uniref:Uncharacterized protein n=1 Tax=Streptomyces pini TaxID=1520580 RepID=A0A1I3Z127_9ACTN|nr:hypothetical protein [Streptomyces pini]SFK37780.1 hypothetical protein SAMN05192584_105280 [Streptomyces pini]